MGRIGQVHLENIHYRIDNAEVIAVMNPSEKGQLFARNLGVPLVSDNPNLIFNNTDIDAVLICSPSNTHAEYIIKAAEAGKAILCEKPLDLSLEKIQEIISVTHKHNVPLMVAFNQRFDPDFAQIKETVLKGEIGDLRTIKIISRDPTPPPISYIKGSGLVDPAIGEAGDIDTGVVILTFENEVTAIIENSRQAAYGYDQRMEVFGSKGMAQANNTFKNNQILRNEAGMHRSRSLDFFMDRYVTSYFNQTNAFIQTIFENKTPLVTAEDGLKATAIALAANKSMKENRPVKLTEILG